MLSVLKENMIVMYILEYYVNKHIYYSLEIYGIFPMENYKKNHIVAKTEEFVYFKNKNLNLSWENQICIIQMLVMTEF